MIIKKKLYKYLEIFSNHKEPKYLKKIRKKYFYGVNKKSMSDFLQGRFLSLISIIKKPRYILEIGTLLGYSSLSLSEGLKKNGLLITIEKNKRYVNYSKKNIEKTKYKNNIKIVHGDALNIINKINIKFDIIFIDADKKNYINYLNLAFKKLNKNGIILIDNVLWKGQVIKKNKKNLAKIIHNFNKKIKKNNYKNIIIPIRDGMSLIIK